MLKATNITTTQKQICIAGVSSGGVIYTVPVGRKFIGSAFAVNANAVTIRINGIALGHIYPGGSGSNYPASTLSYPDALTLLAGTTVALSNTSGTLLGVEDDA